MAVFNEWSPPLKRFSIDSTSLNLTRNSRAIRSRPLSFSRPDGESPIWARIRRKLKNSVFWAAVVPVRTIDQLRRM